MSNATTTSNRHPLVSRGKVQRDFQEIVRYSSQESLLATKSELETSLATEKATGTSRFSDIVQAILNKLQILNANLEL